MLDGSQREEGVQEGEHCGLVEVEPSPRAERTTGGLAVVFGVLVVRHFRLLPHGSLELFGDCMNTFPGAITYLVIVYIR